MLNGVPARLRLSGGNFSPFRKLTNMIYDTIGHVMNKVYSRYGIIIVMCFLTGFNCLCAIDNIDREKLTLETNIEKRVTDALAKLVNPQDFIVMVNIEPIIEEANRTNTTPQIEQLQAPTIKKKDYILPGIPAKKGLGDEEKTSQSPVQVVVSPNESNIEVMKNFIKKITVTVKFDKNVPDNIINEAKTIVSGLVNFNVERGDILAVEKTEFYKKQIPWYQIFTNFPSLIWFLGIVLFAFFLFGPLNVFFQHLLRTLNVKSAQTSDNNQAMAQPQINVHTSGGGGGPVTMSLEEGRSKKPTLFSFINDGNLWNLAYLLKTESPDRTALVLSYMRNDWASFVLSQLPIDLQSKVAVELASVKQLEPDDVEIMELELKKKIDYLIGGSAQIIKICESSDKKTCENIISSLSVSNPELAEQVRTQLLNIDDLYFVDSSGLRILFREIPLPSWAIGLRVAKDVTREKILKTLPTGAAEMLKQEIELNQNVSQAMIDEEEKRIITIMRKLRNEGRIIIAKGEKVEETSENTVKTEEKEETVSGNETNESREERLARIKDRLKKERGG